ncbi:MAG: endolytic transglycosylase MltG [Mogibacterium sp.]|nr:endolytic transglycosylase MltG [Mogibacterium sp.]
MSANRHNSDMRTSVRNSKRGGCRKFLFLLILVLAILVAAGGWYTLGLRAVEPGSEEQVVVEIPNGSGASMIVEILDDAGLVKNKTCAKINARIGGYNGLQANTYIFNKGMSFQQIMKVINEGKFEYLSKESVEVKDGARLTQVAAAISGQLPFSSEEILAKWNDKDYLNQLIEKYWFLTDDILGKDVMNPLEGYLYVDTYYITSGSDTIEGFTEMCLDRMDTELSARKDQIEASGFSVHEFLTLTSIVTKEATAGDQPAVAGVFMNRLDQGMSLGSDVTVGYIFDIDRVELKQSQLDSDNPYNTRKFAGLPPGPISTVIGDAMDAVLNYEKSDDLFFFADENGKVHYFKNQDDFYQGIEDIGLLKDDPEDSEG